MKIERVSMEEFTGIPKIYFRCLCELAKHEGSFEEKKEYLKKIIQIDVKKYIEWYLDQFSLELVIMYE